MPSIRLKLGDDMVVNNKGLVMLKITLLAAVLFVATPPAKALSESRPCFPLSQISMDMDVTASNIANHNTTRTPEGGPYLVKRFECHSGYCDIRSYDQIKMRYEPDHPDADDHGYVAYPDIDLMDEISRMVELTRAYELARRDCSSPL